MKYFTSILILALLTICLLLFVGRRRGTGATEGFQAPVENDANVRAVKKVFGQIKNLSSYLINKDNWFYHMQLIGKSPTEMARIYLKSQRNSE